VELAVPGPSGTDKTDRAKAPGMSRGWKKAERVLEILVHEHADMLAGSRWNSTLAGDRCVRSRAAQREQSGRRGQRRSVRWGQGAAIRIARLNVPYNPAGCQKACREVVYQSRLESGGLLLKCRTCHRSSCISRELHREPDNRLSRWLRRFAASWRDPSIATSPCWIRNRSAISRHLQARAAAPEVRAFA
jgi:hypothetical protein